MELKIPPGDFWGPDFDPDPLKNLINYVTKMTTRLEGPKFNDEVDCTEIYIYIIKD